MTELVIKNGQIITPDGVLSGGWIHCRDGKIAALGQGSAPEGEAFDAQGGFPLPGAKRTVSFTS